MNTARPRFQTLARSVAPIVGGLLDLVYPPRCLVCDRFDEPALCEPCWSTFTPLTDPVCRICGRSVERLESGAPGHCHTCAEAQAAIGAWAFAAARTAAVYEGPLRRAIHRLKYDGCEGLAEPLGAYLANRIVVDALFDPAIVARIDTVAAPPMHPARERRRGFNQARLLAQPLADMLGVPLLDRAALVRVRRNPAQVGLSPDRRRRNLSGAFRVRPGAEGAVTGRRVLLVDDVFTTGSTVHECAVALRAAGAEAVYAATLAGG